MKFFISLNITLQLSNSPVTWIATRHAVREIKVWGILEVRIFNLDSNLSGSMTFIRKSRGTVLYYRYCTITLKCGVYKYVGTRIQRYL